MNKPMTTTAKKAASATRAKARRVADDLDEDLRDTATRVRSKATQARAAVADRAEDVAEDLDEAAAGAGSYARRAVEGLSDRAQDLSDSLRSRNMADMIEDAQGFARRNPAVVAAGALVIGLLLSRAARPRDGWTRRS